MRFRGALPCSFVVSGDYLRTCWYSTHAEYISSTRWFKVAFSSPSWMSMSLNSLKGSLNHPKKITLNLEHYTLNSMVSPTPPTQNIIQCCLATLPSKRWHSPHPLSIYLQIYRSIYLLCTHLSVYLPISTYLSIYLSWFNSPSLSLNINIYIYYIYISTHLPIYPWLHLWRLRRIKRPSPNWRPSPKVRVKLNHRWNYHLVY